MIWGFPTHEKPYIKGSELLTRDVKENVTLTVLIKRVVHHSNNIRFFFIF